MIILVIMVNYLDKIPLEKWTLKPYPIYHFLENNSNKKTIEVLNCFYRSDLSLLNWMSITEKGMTAAKNWNISFLSKTKTFQASNQSFLVSQDMSIWLKIINWFVSSKDRLFFDVIKWMISTCVRRFEHRSPKNRARDICMTAQSRNSYK